jgi:hypothetical protein
MHVEYIISNHEIEELNLEIILYISILCALKFRLIIYIDEMLEFNFFLPDAWPLSLLPDASFMF